MRSRLQVAWGAAIALCLMAFLRPGAGQAQYVLGGGVFGNGGTTVSGASNRVMGTVGQPVTGLSSGAANSVCSGWWCAGGKQVVAVGPAPRRHGDVVEFGVPSPNPSNGAVSFVLYLPRAASVEFNVYDVRGSLARRVVSGVVGSGEKTLIWDGRGANGERVGSGVYFARLVVDGVRVGDRRLVTLR
jgi:hypothetical protein